MTSQITAAGDVVLTRMPCHPKCLKDDSRAWRGRQLRKHAAMVTEVWAVVHQSKKFKEV
ncbi:MAG: hypothetical protein ICV54_05220 [Nostoc sp. C3-bin3]|nr:hypothetical protein [Nostoc sp. C3-bin3]